MEYHSWYLEKGKCGQRSGKERKKDRDMSNESVVEVEFYTREWKYVTYQKKVSYNDNGICVAGGRWWRRRRGVVWWWWRVCRVEKRILDGLGCVGS
jgi:hypothetical protein